MIKDLPENQVTDIGIAVVLVGESPEVGNWKVYVINFKEVAISNVLVSSKGYGEIDERSIKTSTLRHSIGDLDGESFAAIEAIDPAVFGLTNEYWLSYHLNGVMYDKKYIFLPESIIDSNLMRIPLVNAPGIMIK